MPKTGCDNLGLKSVSLARPHMPADATIDSLIIGAGFYGCELALEMRRLGHARVTLAERRGGLLERASFVNQARVHNGYHYPRSLLTAARSHANFERFIDRYSHAVDRRMTKLYAIARSSRVSATQFERFCATVGLPCVEAPPRFAGLFDSSLVEATFLTCEYAFDARALAESLARQIAVAGIDLRLKAEANVLAADDHAVTVAVGREVVRARFVFNCTYGELGSVGLRLVAGVKRELTEMLLIRPPAPLHGVGVTVMDGPFFSVMPFPAAGLHSLSHVRYTPHWATDCATAVDLRPSRSNAVAMLRDATSFMPCLADARVDRSLFEVKAVLQRNETDDGRPILIERSPDTPRAFSVLGAKIDNIFDAQAWLAQRDWTW